jgi:hypothetical protein
MFNPVATSCPITYKAAKKVSLFGPYAFVSSAPFTVTPTETGTPARARPRSAESLASASKPKVDFTHSKIGVQEDLTEHPQYSSFYF